MSDTPQDVADSLRAPSDDIMFKFPTWASPHMWCNKREGIDAILKLGVPRRSIKTKTQQHVDPAGHGLASIGARQATADTFASAPSTSFTAETSSGLSSQPSVQFSNSQSNSVPPQDGLLPLPPPAQQLVFDAIDFPPPQPSVVVGFKLPGGIPNIAAKPFVPKPTAIIPTNAYYSCRGCNQAHDGTPPPSTDRRPYIIRVARHIDRRLSKVLRRCGPPTDTDRCAILLHFDLLPDPQLLNHCAWEAMKMARYCADCVMKEITLQARPVSVSQKEAAFFPDDVLQHLPDGRSLVLPHFLLPAAAARPLCQLLNDAWRKIPQRWTFPLLDPGMIPRPVHLGGDYATLFGS